MNSRKAAAVAMSLIDLACRICGIFMSAMTVLLCFSGLTAKLQIEMCIRDRILILMTQLLMELKDPPLM